jgi:putative flippase GtrA
MNFAFDIFTFIKYGFVGFSGLIVDFSITWLCKERLKINKYFANSLGFVFGVTNNYFLNRYFTFNSQNTDVGKQFLTFALIAIIGLMINTSIIYLTQRFTKINFYVAKIMATILVIFWNFGANSTYTFKK